MDQDENLSSKAAIIKLKSLVDEIMVCLFCTNLKTDDGSSCRPMTAMKVCDQGNIWFYSVLNSDKNKEIEHHKNVQLFFSSPAKSSYLVVNGKAEIILDKAKIDELWKPIAKTWFKAGKDDPNISVIKVTPTNAYYWDTDDNKMINFLKTMATIVTGVNLVSRQKGTIKI